MRQMGIFGCNPTHLASIPVEVWEWTVSSDALVTLKQKHIVSGTIRRADGEQVRVVSNNQPEPRAGNVSPTLEDAYLYFVGSRS